MVATAYAQHGITRSGEPTIEWWTVAADPRVLPLGTRIFVRDPKGRSGEYVVSDTGRKVKGRHIDIFIPDLAEAREFGRHRVTVEVLEYPGQNVRASLRRSAAGGE